MRHAREVGSVPQPAEGLGLSAVVRPYGIVLEGKLELGLELVLEEGRVSEIRPHTGVPDQFVVSPAFVNAHSHLEYRGLQGQVAARGFWPWIREITAQKATQDLQAVREDARRAARENRATGVALIAEHSDRPFSGEAMLEAGLQGVIFQETITFFERETRHEKLALVEERSRQQARAFGGPVYPSPHAVYTVDWETLREFGASGRPISIHLAESEDENAFVRDGSGPIARFHRAHGLPLQATGLSAFGLAKSLGLVREGAQLVHCCALGESEVAELAQSRASVAHCPRSNLRLECPPSPVRRMLEAGVTVGLGMDSPASSGPIDMFDEMRAALHVAELRQDPLSAEQVWRMATDWGARSIGLDSWNIQRGSSVPLIAIRLEDALTTEDLILRGAPARIQWLA